MNKDIYKDLEEINGAVQNNERTSSSEYVISNMPENKDLLNCSAEELDNLISIKKERTERTLQDFDVTDGKSREVSTEEIAKIQELEDLLGIKDSNPYRTLNKEIFEQRVNNSSVSELTSLAMRIGVSPTSHTSELKKSLLKSFDIYARKHNVTVAGQSSPLLDKNSPNYDSVVKLFRID